MPSRGETLAQAQESGLQRLLVYCGEMDGTAAVRRPDACAGPAEGALSPYGWPADDDGAPHLNWAETVIVAAIEAGVPSLAEAQRILDRLRTMIRTQAADGLDGWVEQAQNSLIAPLARGIPKDAAAVRAAIIESWSNEQTEGQINRLKMIKRQMYGRARLDLLEARLVGAASAPLSAKLRQSQFSMPIQSHR